MLLTNFDRFRYHIGADGDNPLSDSIGNKRMFLLWASSVSKSIEKFLDRNLEKKEYTEYYSSEYQSMKFFPKAIPIDISENYNMYYDSDGLWNTDTGEGEFSNIYPSDNNSIINLESRSYINNSRGVKFVFTGGLANYGTKGIYSVDSFFPTLNNYVQGETSSAIGKITAWDSGNNRLSVENNFGSFEVGEILIEYSDEDLTTATGESTTLNSFYKSAITDIAPDISLACDLQLSHDWRFINNFESKGVDQNNVSFFKKSYKAPLQFEPEVINLLRSYVRRIF